MVAISTQRKENLRILFTDAFNILSRLKKWRTCLVLCVDSNFIHDLFENHTPIRYTQKFKSLTVQIFFKF